MRVPPCLSLPACCSLQPFLGVGATQAVKLFVIMSPVGPYYPEGFNPIKLFADTENIRAWPGGVGNTKVQHARPSPTAFIPQFHGSTLSSRRMPVFVMP